MFRVHLCPNVKVCKERYTASWAYASRRYRSKGVVVLHSKDLPACLLAKHCGRVSDALMSTTDSSDELFRNVHEQLKANETALKQKYARLRSQVEQQRTELAQWRTQFEADVTTLLETLERVERNSKSRLERCLQVIEEIKRTENEEGQDQEGETPEGPGEAPGST
jgi:DNA anti-recombination protein RmuC